MRDENGKPYTVRYDAVNAMLLNEFLKEHRKIEKLQATVAELKCKMSAPRYRQKRAGCTDSVTQSPTGSSEVISQRMMKGSVQTTFANESEGKITR